MQKRLTRRHLLQLSATTLAAASVGQPLRASATQPRLTTYTYKKVGNLEIKADVLRAKDDKTRPVVVWIHGGALINGHRAGVSWRVRKAMLEAGCVLVSIDYRLAPETKLPHIIKDVEDAFAWLHTEGARLFNADVSRIAVMGGSAGGYLTLTTGYRVKPRPSVLVAFWGYGDLIGEWYSKPSPHPRHNRQKITEEQALAQVQGPPVSDSRQRKGNGGVFYQYCRQQGIWPQQVSGWDPHSQAEKFTPYMPVRNVDAAYPPTVLIHGKEDTDVPWEQSAMMAEQFRQHEIPHEFLSIPNGEHGLGGGDTNLIEKAYATAFAFARKQLKL